MTTPFKRRPTTNQPKPRVSMRDYFDRHEGIDSSTREPRSMVEAVRRVAAGEVLSDVDDLGDEAMPDDLVWRQHMMDATGAAFVLSRGRRSPE